MPTAERETRVQRDRAGKVRTNGNQPSGRHSNDPMKVIRTDAVFDEVEHDPTPQLDEASDYPLLADLECEHGKLGHEGCTSCSDT